MLPYYRRNMMVLALTSFLAGVSWNQIVPFLPLYLKDLGATADNVSQWSGIVYSAHFLSALVMMPVWGRLSDRFGRKAMAVRAGVSLSMIYFAMSLVRAPWQLALCRLLNGALTGFIPMSTALLAANTPKAYAGRYMANIQTAVAAGNMLGPALGAAMAGLFGVRGTMRISGTAVFLSAMLVALLVDERNKPTGAVERGSLIDDFKLAAKMPTLLLALFINMIASFGTMGVQAILSLHVEELTALGNLPWPPESLIAVVFMLPAIGMVLTAARWVRLSERRGVLPIVILSLTGSGLTCAAAGLTRNVFLFILFFFANGVFIAALRPTAAALIATEVDPVFHGRAFGMQTSAQMLGGFIGPVTGGLVGGLWGNQSVFVFVGLVMVASVAAFRRGRSQRPSAPAAPGLD